MAEKRFAGAERICPYCNAKIENPSINYCPNCNNVFWSQTMRKDGVGMVR